MARENNTAYKRYKSKGPMDTPQYRDVYEDQQTERAEQEQPASKTWRTAVSVLGGVLVAVGVYIALSLVTGTVGMFNDATGGMLSSGASMEGGTGFGAIDGDGGELFGALVDDTSSVGASNNGAVDSQHGAGTVTGNAGLPGGAFQEGDMVIIPGDTPLISKIDWMFQNGYTEAGGTYYDSSVNPVSTEEVMAKYLEYVKAQGGTTQTVVEYTASQGSVTGSDAQAGTDTTDGAEGSSGASQGTEGGNAVVSQTGGAVNAGDNGQVQDSQQQGNAVVSQQNGVVASQQEGGNPWLAMFAPSLWKVAASLFAGLISFLLFYQVMMRNLAKERAMTDMTDINPYKNDQHIAYPEEIQEKFDWFPDVGAHSGVQVSSLISHMMLSNKGLKPVKMSLRAEDDVLDEEGNVETIKGDILYDEDGEPLTKSVPMIDEKMGKALFESAKIPEDIRVFYDARKIPYNPGDKNRDKLKGYETVADLVNNEWEFPEYEPQRPSGAYIVDTAPVNTINFQSFFHMVLEMHSHMAVVHGEVVR